MDLVAVNLVAFNSPESGEKKAAAQRGAPRRIVMVRERVSVIQGGLGGASAPAAPNHRVN